MKVTDIIFEVMTIKEACEWVGCDRSTIKKKIYRGVFKPSEYRKSGDTWLVTRQAIKREFKL